MSDSLSHDAPVVPHYYAQPKNVLVTGFYFTDFTEFEAKSAGLKDRFGQPVTEFELQIIDGDSATCALFNACSISQSVLETWFDDVADLPVQQMAALYFLTSVQGNTLFTALDKRNRVTLYTGDLKQAATALFNELYLSRIPDAIRYYIDYAQFARDCEVSGDMGEFEFAGTTYTCTNPGSL